MVPLLITTALQPPANIYVLKMTLVEKRVGLAKAAVFFWAGLGMKRIVVADATEKTLLTDEDVRMLSAMGVEIEQICYRQNDEIVIEKGKGRGEGDLINFALRNSAILRDSSHFYKCTGKAYCRNFVAIESVVRQNRLHNVFWQEPLKDTVDTRFFYCSKHFCEQFLLPAYETIDDPRGTSAEHVVYELVRLKLTYGHSVRPLISGFSGSLDRPHPDHSLGHLDYHFPCWLSR